MPEDLLLCYNRGCGKEYNPTENNEDSCSFHPGIPVFHDAYKGWSCCSKKCTDFTEFLNIKGCTKSVHSNVKHVEPEKPVVDKEKAAEVIIVRPPETARLPRPPSDTPLVRLQPVVTPSIRKQLEGVRLDRSSNKPDNGEVPIGTACKNGGCKAQFQGNDANSEACVHHPGSPIFHEGLKFWSCCTKRTTDFAAFLDQVGCTSGEHKWIDDKNSETKPVCRHDWHQTGKDVIVSIYAKKYDPDQSYVEVSPIRLKVHLFFPEDESSFTIDCELRGIISVVGSSVNMLSTKVEIKLQKAEPGSWRTLDIPVPKSEPEQKVIVNKQSDCEEFDDTPVDLGDL